MKKETIVKSVEISYELDMRVYNEIYHLNHKFDWIAGIRFWKRIKATGVKIESEVDKKYSSFFYFMIYSIFYRVCRLLEIVASKI